MKFVHIADLHFGKSLHGVSMIDNGDQPFWVEQFLRLVEREKPDAVVIAGDVYDRSAPSGEAMALMDSMLTQLARMKVSVLMISGNHDSGVKLAHLNGLLEANRLYISGSIEQGIKSVRLEDEYGPVNFWLLPYVFPALVANVLKDRSIRDYDTAMRRLLAEQNVDFSQRNVLIAHQNVMANGAAAERGGSETMVGGVGEIDYTAFDGFDYVALGHIHSAQAMGRDTVRYAGSPMCYHFSELKRPDKGPVVVEIGEKGAPVKIETRLLPVKHTLREITGTLAEILERELDKDCREEYLRVVLTDEPILQEAGAQLRAVFAPKGSMLMELVRERNWCDTEGLAGSAQAVREKSLEELFFDFVQDRRGKALDQQQLALIRFISEQVGRADREEIKTPEADVDAILQFVLEQEG